MQEESVRLALLERSQESSEKEMATLREAISEISKVNIRISELFAVHQVKIEQQQQRGDDINRKVEEGIRGLTAKMNTDKEEVLGVIKGLQDKVNIGIGIVLALNFFFIALPPIIGLFKGDLTKPAERAMIRVLDKG
jgi:hypothetical protein